MRRGRGKGKKQNVSGREEREEEKIPAYRRRGRPQKPVKEDEMEDGEEEITVEKSEKTEQEEEEEEERNGSITSKDVLMSENGGRKRKKEVESKESNVTEEEEEDEEEESKISSEDCSVKSRIGYRQNGSRRKNKPRRAAEAVVECNGV